VAKKKTTLREKLAMLFAMLGSDNAGERENARSLIDETLRKNRKSWNDLVELLQSGSSDPTWDAGDENRAKEANASSAAPGVASGTNVSALDLLRHVLEMYLELKPYEYVAAALWILHTHVFNRFMVTPRLALVSPVRGCGKTTLLALLALLVARGRKEDGVSAAAIFRLIDNGHPTLLIDEADNLGLDRNGILRAVLNSGHRKGGSLTRVIKDRPRRFSTFAPMAIAAIGVLPLPIMHRSLIIPMKRATGKLRRLDESDLDDVNIAYAMVLAWAGEVQLNSNPELPEGLRNRPADNWRPLIAIADSFGPAWGAVAREAAVEFARTHRDEDAGVILLNDIRSIFAARGDDRLASAGMVADLIALDDSLWAEWRGLRDDQQPRRLSQGELARLLTPFGIRPRTIWPVRRGKTGKSAKGYFRSQFEEAWDAYCSEDVTPSQPSNIRHLRSG
jgi:Protein of unknown function (DUF3631)